MGQPPTYGLILHVVKQFENIISNLFLNHLVYLQDVRALLKLRVPLAGAVGLDLSRVVALRLQNGLGQVLSGFLANFPLGPDACDSNGQSIKQLLLGRP